MEEERIMEEKTMEERRLFLASWTRKMDRDKKQSTPVGTGVPWLVFARRKSQTFCTISSTGTTFELKCVPEMRNNKVRACYHGWLLLSTKDDHLWSFWNPTTYDIVHLPPLHLEFDIMDIRSCVFTTSPKNPGCTVMLFDGLGSMAYCHPGDQNWTMHDYERDLLEAGIEETIVGSLYKFACLDGVIYAEGFNTQVVAIEFDNQAGLIKLRGIGLERPLTRMSTVYRHTYLVESFGEIFSIHMLLSINGDIFSIEVFRLDFNRKVWVEVENLDGRLIFLDSAGNYTSCLATDTGIRGNQIFYTQDNHLYDNHLYVYDLEEGTILNSLPCPGLRDSLYEPFWVMPEYLRIDDQVNVKPEYRINMGLEQHIQVEVQTPRDLEASVDQYPHSMQLDIFTEIANKLEPLDYLEFRATCKLFRLAAPAIQRRVRLVTFRYNKSIFSFTDPKHNKTYSMKVPESLKGMYISSSKDGYLVLVDAKTVYYFNPFTRMQEKLPASLVNDNKLNFSSSPSSPDCLAVKLDDLWPHVYYIRKGEDDWSKESFEGDIRGFEKREPGVFHEGMFYFLGRKGNLGVLKIEEDGVSWEALVKPVAPCNDFRYAYLMKCNGKLMAVFLGRDGNWVKVFRLDHSQMIWRRVKGLGYYTLFISNISSFVSVARSPGMENKIYFSRFYDQRIVYYSLQTEKFHTHGSNVVLDNFVNTKEQLYSTWIEPVLD